MGFRWAQLFKSRMFWLLSLPVVVFWRELLRTPADIGAVLPSSQWLGHAIAAAIPLNSETLVVEVGAGTGAVTRALLRRGVAPSRLCLIERSSALCELLRRRFPRLLVVRGDAAELTRHLGADRSVGAIVSSLPLRSLSQAAVHAIAGEMHALLDTDGVLVQYTYGIAEDCPLEAFGFKRQRASLVLRNIPPARIDVLRKEACL